jgi:hypothetical protein
MNFSVFDVCHIAVKLFSLMSLQRKPRIVHTEQLG